MTPIDHNSNIQFLAWVTAAQKGVYKGKVREVYTINDNLLVMIATDRLSAFDVVMPKGIPYKGQILFPNKKYKVIINN